LTITDSFEITTPKIRMSNRHKGMKHLSLLEGVRMRAVSLGSASYEPEQSKTFDNIFINPIS